MMSSNHITIGIYANKDYVYNVVRDCDLQGHIEYNETFRFGRLLYVDGERVYNGCMKEEYLHEYDELAKKVMQELLEDKNILLRPTIPYR